ncbi:MAG: MFS transporter [Alphaproteobacteria bacterium]|jgi:putative MFS transporter|nr:MFS transporter [Alphaproteobacteria bacterium]
MQKIRDFLQREQVDKATLLTILVAALGYFVDIFDLLMFSIVRVQSLKSIGVPEDQILETGIFLINTQMAGLLIGGIVWGIWGDKLGRISVLFGSILLYSIANIANGFVHDVEMYAVFRFIAGVGLAGELGAGVTLASELFPRAWRGLGTTFIASIGVLGAVFAAFVAEMTDWRTAYIIGGIMGLALLLLRINVRESGLYEKMAKSAQNVSRGNFLMLLTNGKLFTRYLAVILVGAPLWGIVGLFITFTPEFAKDFGMTEIPKAGTAVLACYAGLFVGDALSGILSQFLRSRRKAVAICLVFMSVSIAAYVLAPHETLFEYYSLCFMMGVGAGYWAMFVQMGAEQFGTNIRATAATSIPNMVRGFIIPMSGAFHFLIPYTGVTMAGVTVLAVMISLAFLSLIVLRETFHEDLDYVEV